MARAGADQRAKARAAFERGVEEEVTEERRQTDQTRQEVQRHGQIHRAREGQAETEPEDFLGLQAPGR